MTGVEVLELAEVITDRPDEVMLLGLVDGKKMRAGYASLGALRIRSSESPSFLDRRSFTVVVADDILALDVDDPNAANEARSIAEAAAAAGYPPVIAASGRVGGLHVLIRISDSAFRQELGDRAREAGIDVRTGSPLRPPGSAHPGGGASQLLDPADPREAASRLARRTPPTPVTPAEPAPSTAAALPQGPPRAQRRTWGPRLSAAIAAVLRDGDNNPDRSVTLQRVVTGMVNAGWTCEQAWTVLASPNAGGARKLQERLGTSGEDAAWKYLVHCWRAAEAFCARNPAVGVNSELLDVLAQISDAADGVGWAGEAGSNAWMVLHHLIGIGRRGGGLTPSASERQLAEATSMSRATVHGALERLKACGWLEVIRTGSGPRATLWQLRTPSGVPGVNQTGESGAGRSTAPVASPESSTSGNAPASTPACPEGQQHRSNVVEFPGGTSTRRSDPLPHPHTPTHGGCEDSGSDARGSHDAFRRKALGSLGYRVLYTLRRRGALSTSELAAALGCHPGSVGRVLRERLGGVGLVERLGGGRWGVIPTADEGAALDWAAAKFDTVGAGERQRRWHAVEREVYRSSPGWARDRGWWDSYERAGAQHRPVAAAA